MEINTQPLLQFHSCDITNIHFEAIRSREAKEETPIGFHIVPKVFFPKEHPDYFRIIMEVSVEGEGFFHLTLSAIGTFQLKNLPESNSNLRKNFVNANAPAIMFPYVRSFISTLTSNIGAAAIPITLPTQFFKGDLEVINQE